MKNKMKKKPSVYSACNNPRYESHLLPITLPHVKQRIGIIIFTQKIRG